MKWVRDYSQNSNKLGQRCIYVMSMFSSDITKQEKIFNDRASEMRII